MKSRHRRRFWGRRSGLNERRRFLHGLTRSSADGEGGGGYNGPPPLSAPLTRAAAPAPTSRQRPRGGAEQKRPLLGQGERSGDMEEWARTPPDSRLCDTEGCQTPCFPMTAGPPPAP